MNAKRNLVRFLIIASLYLTLQRYLHPLLYSSPPVLPAYLWHEEGWVAVPQSSPAPSFHSAPPRPFALVKEEELPWYLEPPLDLRDLRTRYDAPLFITGFSLGLNNPLLDEEHNIALAAGYLAGTVIEPQQVFSLNKTLGPRTKARGFGPG
ncbi:MAG TPA: VanW family protein, partial [Firmicutes bacterium]|nr:VanW family protein [Bacillota bacterium]